MADSNSIKTLLKKASEKLATMSDSACLDAELLLAHCLEKNQSYLHTWPEHEVSTKQLTQFEALIEKRLTNYPVAYLLGKKAFWTLDLIVTPDVLIPRPETELLVEIVLDKIKNIQHPKILDLGTGSGAIALALASERTDARVIATDYSEKALAIARKNSVELKLDRNVSFIQSDWLRAIKEKDFDLIVSNPPYIDPEDLHLQGTIRHEPQQALVAENKGMSDIEKIIQMSHLFLKTGGWLMFEHGFDQAEKTIDLFTQNHYSSRKSFRDLNNNFRVTLGRK